MFPSKWEAIGDDLLVLLFFLNIGFKILFTVYAVIDENQRTNENSSKLKYNSDHTLFLHYLHKQWANDSSN